MVGLTSLNWCWPIANVVLENMSEWQMFMSMKKYIKHFIRKLQLKVFNWRTDKYSPGKYKHDLVVKQDNWANLNLSMGK